MSRLEGTGKDPLGRYGKGEVFDVPRFLNRIDAENGRVNPAYQELIDKGYAKALDPEGDPARTRSQIAAGLVDGSASLTDPVDRELARDITEADAYAITHTGDPSASGDGDLKTDAVREGQEDDPKQRGAGGLPVTELQEQPADDESEASESSSQSSRRTSSRRGGGGN